MKSMGPFVRRVVALFALSISIALCGCVSLRLKFGQRIALDKVSVTSIRAQLAVPRGIAPGQKIPIAALLTQPNGDVLRTEGWGQGKVMWRDIDADSRVVQVMDGVMYLPDDPRVSEGKTGHVKLTVRSHPGVFTEFDVPIRYDYAYDLNFKGLNGSDGQNGLDGTSGYPGSLGSIDPQHPFAGGDGGDGRDGDNGKDGENGTEGPAVTIRMAMKPGTEPLVEAQVSTRREDRYYLLDAHGATLRVASHGGRGGVGGRGGRGGKGGSGGDGIPKGHSGRDGMDGRNGFDGHAGRDGLITVVYNPEVQPFLGILKFEKNAHVEFKEEMVGQIW